MDEINRDESIDNRFVYSVELPNLQEMASYRIALSLWRHYIPDGKFTATLNTNPRGKELMIIFGLNANYRKEYFQLVDCLNAPQSIKSQLKKACKKINYEMKLWVRNLYNIVASSDVITHDPNWCVWLANGTIDHEQSAVKMLSSIGSELNAEVKFEILCEFCFEDELAKFPINSLPNDYIIGEDVRDCHLLNYWYYYIKNELSRIPRLSSGCRSLFVEIILEYFDPNAYPNWKTVEYFWNRLNAEEQMSVAKSLFNDNFRLFFSNSHARLLGMMSWDQQRRLLNFDHMSVIFILIKQSELVKPAYWAWTHSQHLLSDSDFASVIVNLLHLKLDMEEWMSWLCDIWDSASDQLKIYTLKYLEDELVSRFDVEYHVARSAFKFLHRILSKLGVDVRKEMFVKIAESLAPSFIDLDSFDELSKLCLPNADDGLKLKKSIIKTKEFECVELMKKGKLDLNVILDFYLVTSNDIRTFKLDLLKSEAFQIQDFMYELDKWNRLCKFIDELYGGNVLALQIRKQLLFSCTFDSSHFDGDTSYDVTQLFRIVESEFEEEEIETLKRDWINSFQSMFKTNDKSSWYEYYFDEIYACKFVKWCVGNSGGAAFVDDVFNRIFVSLNDRFSESLLSKLNVCLKSLLMNDEEVKKYKLAKISSVRDLEIFQSVLDQNDELRLKILLDWFFDGDESLIREFRSKKLQHE